MSNPAPTHPGLLNGAELLSRSIPTVRKGGMDPTAVGHAIAEAAATIDALNAHIDAQQSERENLISALDEAKGASTSVEAAKVLAAAERVAAEITTDAGREAEALVRDACERAEAADAQAAQLVQTAVVEVEAMRETAASENRDLHEANLRLQAARDEIISLFQSELAVLRREAGAILETTQASVDAALDGACEALANQRDSTNVALATVVAELTAAADVKIEALGPEAVELVGEPAVDVEPAPEHDEPNDVTAASDTSEDVPGDVGPLELPAFPKDTNTGDTTGWAGWEAPTTQ